MVMNTRYVFVLSLGMLAQTNFLAGMTGTPATAPAASPAAPHDIPGASDDPREEKYSMRALPTLYEAINKADEEGLRQMKIERDLVKDGHNQDFFHEYKLARGAGVQESPFWHCLGLLMIDSVCSMQYTIRYKMIFILVDIYKDEKDPFVMRKNAQGVDLFHYMIDQKKPNYELISEFIKCKICDPNSLDAQGDSAIINVDDEVKMQRLIDLGVAPIWNGIESNSHSDRVVYFVLGHEYPRWSIIRRRTDEEVARIQKENAQWRARMAAEDLTRKRQNGSRRCVIS